MSTAKEAEILKHYQQLYNEYQQLANKMGELEVDKREHESVVTALNGLNADRKCWRLVGGILVERTAAEVLPAVQKNAAMLEDTLRKMEEQLTAKEKELTAYKDKYKIRVKAPSASSQENQSSRDSKGEPMGVLV